VEARQINTEVVVWKDGKVCHLSADEAERNLRGRSAASNNARTFPFAFPSDIQADVQGTLHMNRGREDDAREAMVLRRRTLPIDYYSKL